MIYLIDDNQSEQQQKRYNANFLFDDSFKQELELVYKVEQYQLETLGKKLKKADAILLHHTFADVDDWGGYLNGSRKIRDFIEDVAEKHDIPLVVFSNGFNETAFDDDENPILIENINKDVFYKYLFEFLQYYKEHRKVELKILVYGKDFKIQDAIQFIEKTIDQLKTENPLSDFSVEKIDFPVFKRFYESLGYGLFDDFWVDSGFDDKTVLAFITKLKKIKKSLLKYGRYL